MRTKLIAGIKFVNSKYDDLLKVIKHNQRLIKAVVCEDQPRHYLAVVDDEKMLEIINSVNSNIQEVIASYPCKIFFDVDGKDPKLCTLQAVKDVINKCFNNPMMAISGYESAVKNSYHIVLPELLVANYEGMMALKRVVMLMKEENQFFDDAVYRKNSCMKCVNQSKAGGCKQAIIEDQNIKNHIINSFINPSAMPFDFSKYEDQHTINIANYTPETADVKQFVEEKIIQVNPVDLGKASRLLDMMPINADTPRKMCLKFCNFAKFNGISFNDFWTWNKKKNNSLERRKRYESYFNSLNDTTKYKCSMAHVKNILSMYYPNIHKPQDLKTSKFIKSFNLPTVNIPAKICSSFETADIHNHHFEVKEKAVIFNIGMGGGKTGATVQYLKDNQQKSFIWLSVRQALAYNTHTRLKHAGLDVANYLDEKRSTQKVELINESKNLMLSCESLHYLNDTNKFDVLVIDEIESLLKNWDSTTHGEHVANNFYNFCELFTSCRKIILLDAFTTTHTTSFLKSLGVDDILIYSSNYQKPTRILKECSTFNDIQENIMKDINNNKKVFIFYPFLNPSSDHMGIHELEKYILTKNKTGRELNILTYFSNTSDAIKKTLKDVDNKWKAADVIICNSSITVGVNYEGADFDKIYLIASARVNLPRDLLQVSLRIRSPKCNIIDVFFFDKINGEVYQYNDFYKSGTDDRYNMLIDNIEMEKHSDFMSSFFKLCDMAAFDRSAVTPHNYTKNKHDSTVTLSCDTIKVMMPYENIRDLSESEAQTIQVDKVFLGEASMTDKFELSKYYFDKRFNNLSYDDRKFIWNMRHEKTFKNFGHPLVKHIEEDNKSDIVDLNFKKLIVSDATKKYIVETFAQRDYKKESTMILKLLEFLLGGINVDTNHGNHKFNDELIDLYEIYKQNNHVFLD